MRRHKNLLDYYLQSALELAREDSQVMIEYLIAMALTENADDGKQAEQKKSAA